MKVVLIKNVVNIGKRGDVKNVSDGYAMNFLLPQKLAEVATEKKISELKSKKENKIKYSEYKQTEQKLLVDRLNKIKLKIAGKVSSGGKLFAGISSGDIQNELNKHGISIDEKYIKLNKHIKDIGQHKIKVEFSGGIDAEINLNIVELKD